MATPELQTPTNHLWARRALTDTAPTDFPENETALAAAGLQQNQES